jgi:hypothetical protein
MRISKKTQFVVAATAAGSIGLSGVAFGWWTSSGNGSGAASTGSSTLFVVTADSVTTNTLTPGGPTQTVGFTVHNPSTGHQHVAGVSVKVANTDGTPWSVTVGPLTCDATDFQVSDAAAGAAKTFAPDADLGPNSALNTADDYTNSVTVQLVNKNSNQDACQSLTAVPLYVSAT